MHRTPVSILVLIAVSAVMGQALAQITPSSGTLSVTPPRITIQSAIDAAPAGGTVLVEPGTYHENIDFHGKAITVKSLEGPAATRIEGVGGGAVVTFANGEGIGSILEGFTVAEGVAGGIRCDGAGPIIRDCWIRLNSAGNGGGVSFVDSPTGRLENCRFEDNAAIARGAGVDCVDSTVVLDGCHFLDCVAAEGGAVAALRGSLTVLDSTFHENQASGDGGALHVDNATLEIRRSTFFQNKGRNGGALLLEGATGATMTGCLLIENSGVLFGGGLDVILSDLQITACTLGFNSAPSGGGIGGLDATVSVHNSIVHSNSPNQIIVNGTSTTTVSYSDIQGGYPGTGNLDVDPGFQNGAGGNLRLDTTSLLIDQGDATGLPATDFEGDPRIVGAAPDIGADEFNGPKPEFIARRQPDDLRMICYNVQHKILPSEDPSQAAKFARIVQSLEPDILALQEVSASTTQAINLLNGILPNDEGPTWYAFLASTGDMILSKYPLSMTSMFTVPQGDKNLAMALIDLPDARFPNDLYLMNNHYKCCGADDNDVRRQWQSDAMIAWMKNAREPGGIIDLPVGTAMSVVGDLNMVHSNQPGATLLNGDILDQSYYGPDSAPDWDGSMNADASPAHNDREPYDYTWRNDSSIYAPSRMDRVTWTDSVLESPHSYVLNTTLMSPGELAATGLDALDVTNDLAGIYFDHLPVVVDFRAPSAAAYGSGCPGTGGTTPRLSVLGAPLPGAKLLISTEGVPPGSTQFLFAGATAAARPVGSGCFLRVAPPTGPFGPFPPSFTATVPEALSPVRATFQAFVPDAGASGGWSSTNGVLLGGS